MRRMGWAIAVVLVLVLGFAAYVRLAPSDPEVWHVDPMTVSPGRGYLVRPEGGDSAGPLFEAKPEEALTAFDAVARATPRTVVLAGSVAAGRITYVTRSALWGFPDYTTVSAVPVEGGTRLAIYARHRFGQSDLGVNAARVEGWLRSLEP